MFEMFSSHGPLLFLGMVFAAVFLLVNSLMVPTFGTERHLLKRLRSRMAKIADEFDGQTGPSLLREKQQRALSPLERWLEGLPGIGHLNQTIQQAGRDTPAHRLMLSAVGLGAVGCLGAFIMTQHPLIALAAGVGAGSMPFILINRARNQRLDRFEEQLPEALDIITRALRAGHPFNESLHLVSEEMDGPVAKEFGMTFNDVNYGTDIRAAFLYLLERVPSMSLMAVITSVLIQRETGGNLAETLENNSKIVRGRFRFQRKVRTLSAEGRMSAWVLTLIPFGLFVLLMVSSPDYLPILVKDPRGPYLIGGAFLMMVFGILWMRSIIRIEV